MSAPETTSPTVRWRLLNRSDLIIAAIAVVVLLPSSVLALVQTQDRADTPVVVTATVLFALLHALSLAAVPFPVGAFIGASLVMLPLATLPVGDAPAAMYPSCFAYLICIGQVAAQRRGRIAYGALGVGILGAVIIALTPAVILEPQVRLGAFAGLTAMIAAAWTFGLLQQLRLQQADERARTRVQQAIVEERMRINRDLHDVVAHSMTVMIAQAEAARAFVHDDPDRTGAAMSVIADVGREALRGMRGIVAADADAADPVPEIEGIPRLIESASNVDTEVRFEEVGSRGRLDPGARIALHRAMGEAIANAIRHTDPPRRIDVRWEWQQDRLNATIRDDGGSGPAIESPGVGIGLLSLAERVRSAGGTMQAQALHPEGWTVQVVLPASKVPPGTPEAAT